MSNLGIAVVGAARWGSNVVRAFASTRGAALRAVCDLNPELLARTASAHPGVRTTPRFEDLLTDPEVSAVALAVDSPSHHRLARRALEAGRHVLVEKPLALTVAHGQELCDVAERTGRVLMVGHLLLYHPAVVRAKRSIDAGELGDIRYIHSQRVNLGVVRSTENAWWSLAPHDLAVALYLFGDAPSSVSATGACYLQTQRGIEDVVFGALTWADGRMAHVHVSWIDPEKRRALTIVGSKGTLTVDGAAPLAGVDEPLRAECQHFVDCVRTGERPRSDGAQGLAVLRILAAGERSMRLGGAPVPVAP
jgi:predicted dehydrogenase